MARRRRTGRTDLFLCWLAVLVGGLGIVPGPPVAHAQQSAAPMPRTYGTQDLVAHTISAWAFSPRSVGDAAAVGVTGLLSRYCVGGPCSYIAPLSLPEGAQVEGVELNACDTSPSAEVAAVFWRKIFPSTLVPLATVATGDTDMLGCRRYSLALATPRVIDTALETYIVQVDISGTAGSGAQFSEVRVYYRLRVSPAPAVATFDDVSTSHPFFQVIEALVAAGITSGCSAAPPLFCPDDPVTRKQIAAFLARALGLHFAP